MSNASSPSVQPSSAKPDSHSPSPSSGASTASTSPPSTPTLSTASAAAAGAGAAGSPASNDAKPSDGQSSAASTLGGSAPLDFADFAAAAGIQSSPNFNFNLDFHYPYSSSSSSSSAYPDSYSYQHDLDSSTANPTSIEPGALHFNYPLDYGDPSFSGLSMGLSMPAYPYPTFDGDILGVDLAAFEQDSMIIKSSSSPSFAHVSVDPAAYTPSAPQRSQYEYGEGEADMDLETDSASSPSSSGSSASPSTSPSLANSKTKSKSNNTTGDRRPSTASSTSSLSSSSGPSPSTSTEEIDASPVVITPKEEHMDAASELAHRVRQSAGVMLAVPMNAVGINGMNMNLNAMNLMNMNLNGMNVGLNLQAFQNMQMQQQQALSMQSLQGLLGAGGYFASPQLAPNTPANAAATPKLPIPRLPRHLQPNNNNHAKSSSSNSTSAASTPPPNTPPQDVGNFKFALDASANANGGAAATTNLARPKTSHTTIERRYRTNLNARIQSLRMAVPALRVLEDREGGNGKKIKKNVKGSVIFKSSSSSSDTPPTNPDGTPIDVIDERGYVDGVKVARKCSKANVLGKAVEYIRVLKRRETRLRSEQAGLKTLVAGLVGGPALVREWEREWRRKFGGEERDELGEGEGEGDAEEGGDGEEEGEDGEGASEDEDDEEVGVGKKRKRIKVVGGAKKQQTLLPKEKKVAPSRPSSFAQSQGPVGQQQSQAGFLGGPEKRKRGRPRKVLPPAVTIAPIQRQQQQQREQEQEQEMVVDPIHPGMLFEPEHEHEEAQLQRQPQHQQQQQYLLAVFALFSFFNNSPFSPSSGYTPSHHHHHQHAGGQVLTPPLAYAPEIVAQFVNPPSSGLTLPSAVVAGAQAQWGWREYAQVFHLFVSVVVLAGFLGRWLGVSLSLGVSVNPKVKMGGSVLRLREVFGGKGKEGEGRRIHGKAGWVRYAEECLVQGKTASLSLSERIHILLSLSSSSSSSPPPTHTQAQNVQTESQNPLEALTTLSQILLTTPYPAIAGLAKMRARAIWARARALAALGGARVREYERLVFEGVSVEGAGEVLLGCCGGDMTMTREAQGTPLRVVGETIVMRRIKKHVGVLFVDAVGLLAGGQRGRGEDEDEEVGEGMGLGLDIGPVSGRPKLTISTTFASQEHHLEFEEDEQRQKDKLRSPEWARTICAARELGGRVEELGRVFERVWKLRLGFGRDDEDGEDDDDDDDDGILDEVKSLEDGEGGGESAMEREIKDLMRALVLFRKLFGSSSPSSSSSSFLGLGLGRRGLASASASASAAVTPLSPPPSPPSGTQQQHAHAQSQRRRQGQERATRMLLDLRKALGSRVFEDSEMGGGEVEEVELEEVGGGGRGQMEMEMEMEMGLEDARDRVVDLIVDVEVETRRTRSGRR